MLDGHEPAVAPQHQEGRQGGRRGRPASAAAHEDLKAFHDLYVHTAERDHFTPRPLGYFQTMLEALDAEGPDRIRLWLARHQGDLVAATIAIRVGAHAWYSYGASSTEKREVRGSNAVQWAMIQDALAAGADVYDLRGITDTLDPDDPHAGLIQFKVGTGGEAVEYAGEWDLPLNRLLYRAFDLYMARGGRAAMSLTLTVDGDRWRRTCARWPTPSPVWCRWSRATATGSASDGWPAGRDVARRRHHRRRHLRGAAPRSPPASTATCWCSRPGGRSSTASTRLAAAGDPHRRPRRGRRRAARPGSPAPGWCSSG